MLPGFRGSLDGSVGRRFSGHHPLSSDGRSLHVNPIVRRHVGTSGHGQLRSAWPTCSTQEPAHHSHAGSSHAGLEREREVVLEEPVLLQELEPGSPEPLSIDPAAAAQLLPDGRSNSKKQQHINLSSKDRFVLGYEVDGMMQPRHSLVTLRVDPPSNRVQVHGPLALDTLQGCRLAAWRREANGRLVAVLRSKQAAKATTGASQPSLTPAPLDPVAAPAHPIILPPSTPVAPSKPVADPHPPFLQTAQHQIQQQFAFSAAGAAAMLSAAQQAMHLPLARARTFVPSHVRPISEVYVPFRLWRELFDGSTKPVPPSGAPLQIVVTGAVQLAQQEVVLVRQITRYGYFVLKGIKGLSRLRGKLLVRWSLLVSGVLEMEVVDEPAMDEQGLDDDEVQLLTDGKGEKRSSRR